MPHPRGRRLFRRLGIPLLAVALAALAAGTATAHTGAPGTIHIVQTGPTTISASGTWTWPAEASATKLSYVAFAVDWGDVSSGNAVGTFHIGDGTPATNVVTQTSPTQGTSGAWGAVSHTYAQPGTYNVCVIIYDLGTSTPFLGTGYHSTQAGGTNHNTDNSVDKGNAVPALCATFTVAAPTPTPFESVQGATGVPGPTAPSTSVAGATAPQDQHLPLFALLFFGLAVATAAVSRFARVRR
jgi:hypothetical protein